MSNSISQTQTTSVQAPKKRARGWWYPWIFVAFFVVVVSVNGIMMYFAYNTWTGLETEGHYVKGLEYDKNIAAAKAQAALGWYVKLDVQTLAENGTSRDISYKVTFLDHDKKPVEGLKAHTYFERVTHEGMDVNGPAEVIEPGVVGGKITLKQSGLWNVRVYGESLGRKYQHVERIVVN
jgi:nitrogen fixation protein FixH